MYIMYSIYVIVEYNYTSGTCVHVGTMCLGVNVACKVGRCRARLAAGVRRLPSPN